MMNVKKIRDRLREGESGSLKRRRWIATLAAFGIVDFVIISLYQLGVIRHLPDPPGKIFKSDKVNASEKAYEMGLPDGPISLGVYALNIGLASYKGDNKSGRPIIADLALAATVFANAYGAAKYMKNMVQKQKKACPYCIGGALINFIMVPIIIRELLKKKD